MQYLLSTFALLFFFACGNDTATTDEPLPPPPPALEAETTTDPAQVNEVIDVNPGNVSTPLGELIRINSPQPGTTISLPYAFGGEAVGPWYFEGDFGVSLETSTGITVGRSVATAKGDWMVEDFVPFTGMIELEEEETESGKMFLVFMKSNPSDGEVSDRSVKVPVMVR